LDKPDDNNKVIPVSLTKEQIENSPSIEADRPVSRQDEWNYYSYYDWPGYWVGPYAWGPYSLPRRAAIGWSEDMRRATGNDPHLRSMKEVTGYNIQALDDSVGHVEDFIIDDDTKAIRYLIVDTRNWWPGKKVLVSPQMDRPGELGGLESLCQPDPGGHQGGAGVQRVRSDHARLRSEAVSPLQPISVLGSLICWLPR